jgi:small subunit ribosomal protein S18
MKQCFFSQNNIKYVDYKDVELLKKFLNPHARVQGKKKTNVKTRSQRQLAQAIKRARFMALLPFVAR